MDSPVLNILSIYLSPLWMSEGEQMSVQTESPR